MDFVLQYHCLETCWNSFGTSCFISTQLWVSPLWMAVCRQCCLILAKKTSQFVKNVYHWLLPKKYFSFMSVLGSNNTCVRVGVFKGTVAWDGLFAKSNPSDLVMEDLKYFWPGSTKYRVTSKITSFSVLAEYAKHMFSVLAEYAKWRKFLRFTKYFASYFNFANMYLIPN